MRLLLSLVFVLCSLLSFSQEEIDPDGYNKIYYPNGSLQSEGLMKNGKPEGYWKTYHSTGIIKSEGNRKNHILDSTWVFYNSVGDTISKIEYRMGKKNGYMYSYYTSGDNADYTGRIKTKELYVNDKKQGVSYTYYPNGKLHETVEYKNNKANGYSIEYSEDNLIITIKRFSKGNLVEREKVNRYNDQKQKVGDWKVFYEGIRVKSEVKYVNDLMHGYYKEYLPNGSLKLTLLYDMGNLIEEVDESDKDVEIKEEFFANGAVKKSGPYINSIPVGIHREFDEEGIVVGSLVYDDYGSIVSNGIVDKEGKKQGEWKYFYADQSVKAIGKYQNNKRTGLWKFYFSNGKVEQEGKYKNGKYEGLWKWYFSDGSLWIEEEFYSGREEGIFIEYNIFGDILVEGNYFDGEKEGEWMTKIGDHTEKGKYVTGLKDGKWKYYYDDGSLKFEGDYIQGNKEGKHKYFYSNGLLKEEQIYTSGLKTSHWKKYDEFGNLIVTISYKNDKEYRINGVRIEFPEDTKTVIK